MRTAALMLTSKFGRPVSVILRLDWAWQPGSDLRYWSCAPGFLGVNSGYWRESALSKNIVFFDYDDNHVGWCLKVDCDYTGYPFSDLAGDEGPFQRMGNGGGIMDASATWRFLNV